MNVTTDQIRNTFFTAMRNGYASDAPKGTVIDLPCSKTIRFKLGAFDVIDLYFVNPESDYSFGFTVIWHNNHPVWVMQYAGQYPKELIPFLKRALRRNYEQSIFTGGRGPDFYEEAGDNLLYTNCPAINDFSNFMGREEIMSRKRDGAKLEGWHRYFGFLLAPRPE